MLVVALGYDAHKDDPIRVLRLEAADFGAIAHLARAFGQPTLVLQEGGYAVDANRGDCLGNLLEGFGSPASAGKTAAASSRPWSR